MNCKVIATAFNNGREYRTSSVYPYHNQIADTADAVLDMLKEVVAIERKTDPGVPVDLVIVNSYLDYPKGFSYLEEIDGTELKQGKIVVLTRDNHGGAFGSYNHAYQNTKYDNYLFTEDDILIGKDGYFKELLEAKEKVGAEFLALVGIGETPSPHAHGGVGLVSRETLKKVHGNKLPFYGDFWDKEKVIALGEVPFTGRMKMHSFSKGWNDMCRPYYVYKS